MSASSADFEIRLKSVADISGLHAMSAGLQGEIEATKALGKDTSDLEAKLSRVRDEMIQMYWPAPGARPRPKARAQPPKKAGKVLKFSGTERTERTPPCTR